MRFPFDESALQSRLQDLQIALLRSANLRRRVLTQEEQAVQDFGHSDAMRAVAWSPDGACIASGGNDNAIHIWEPA